MHANSAQPWLSLTVLETVQPLSVVESATVYIHEAAPPLKVKEASPVVSIYSLQYNGEYFGHSVGKALSYHLCVEASRHYKVHDSRK